MWWQRWDCAYIRMAEEGTELPIPLNEGERDNVAIPIEPVVLEEVRVRRELYEDRYRLEAPTLSGEEAVKQFIQEFQEVMEVARWPPRVALLQPESSIERQGQTLRHRT